MTPTPTGDVSPRTAPVDTPHPTTTPETTMRPAYRRTTCSVHAVREGDMLAARGSFSTVIHAEVSLDEPTATFTLSSGAVLTYPLAMRVPVRTTSHLTGSF